MNDAMIAAANAADAIYVIRATCTDTAHSRTGG
jgi:hypothetical protein